jgi:hypothetical protein
MRSTGLDECNYKILIATIFASIITGCAMPVAEGLPPAKPRIQYVSRTSYQCIPDPTTNSTECEGIFNFPPGYVYKWGGGATSLSGIRAAIIQDTPPKAPHYWPQYWVVDFDYYNATIGWQDASAPFVLFTLADQSQVPRLPPIAVGLTRAGPSDCTYGGPKHQTSSDFLPDSIDIQDMSYISYPADNNAPIPPNVHPC